jgi:hypothetical protein
MTRFGIFGAALLACASFAASDAIAATPYDGYWSVVIMTQRGACEPAYRSAVSISNGVVSGGDGMASLYGRVGQNGAVSVVVTSGVQNARGSGRLGRSSGSGSWAGRGSAGVCSGRWTAYRR